MVVFVDFVPLRYLSRGFFEYRFMSSSPPSPLSLRLLFISAFLLFFSKIKMDIDGPLLPRQSSPPFSSYCVVASFFFHV